jgi:Phosphotransferase enzyme family
LGHGLGEMLRQSDIAHYLLSLGLVKPREVVEERLTIADASRRNSVFLAEVRGGPTYVVKQAEPRAAPTLAHEAAVLGVLADVTDVAGQVPAVMHADPDAGPLVLRTPGAALDWNEHQRASRFPRTPSRGLGRLLAALHRLPADSVEALPPGIDPMWGLSLPEPPYELLLDLSTGAQDLVARLQASQPLCNRLAELGNVGPDGALVHGDVRWDNCLAVAALGARRRTRPLLVDWELAGHGLEAFDVGTVLAEYLRAWVESIPIVDPLDPGRLVAQARHPLWRIQPAVQSFWSAYALASRRRPTLERVIQLAAVRILQTAVEQAQGSAVPSAHHLALLRLADNLLRDPGNAAYRLLGLTE